MTKPITPDQVGAAKVGYFPPEVFEAFNAEIAAKFSNGSAKVKQDDVIARIIVATELTRSQIFEKGYLNVEDAYRDAGWKVNYDKPAYNESYPATFEFRRA